MSHELYKRYRPDDFNAVMGQPESVALLTAWIQARKVPHALLFSGPSGTGKTTLARILRRKIGCGDMDYKEVNSAQFRGIDMIREIQNSAGFAPTTGRCRVWVVDECHKLTGDAQNGFLKLLEDTPKHVYFMLCTTDPDKLLAAIRTRCTQVILKDVGPGYIKDILQTAAEGENFALDPDLESKIVEVSNGSPRKALVLLDQVIQLPDNEQRLRAVVGQDMETPAIHICRCLMDGRSKWVDMAAILNNTDLSDPEGLRYMVLGYCTKILSGGRGNLPLVGIVMDCFRRNFYDTKKFGVWLACFEAFQETKRYKGPTGPAGPPAPEPPDGVYKG